MEPEVLGLIVLSIFAGFAALGGWVSHLKHRQPLEGFLLGAILGPIGLILELRKPFFHRPPIDEAAFHSFRSLVEHQADSKVLVLHASDTGNGRSATDFGSRLP